MEIPKILLIEDDKEINELIKNALKKEIFNVDTAYDGSEGIFKYNNNKYNLVLLDLMLPIISGEEVLREIREKSNIPVIILSAKDESLDKILGLSLGADDYVTKPFVVAELIARIKAQLRRFTIFNNQGCTKSNIITEMDLEINLDTYEVKKNNNLITLTSKEFAILKFLMSNKNKVFTKSQIFNNVWEEEYLSCDSTITVHIRRLREKIEDKPSSPKYIKTIWGIGYKFGGNN